MLPPRPRLLRMSPCSPIESPSSMITRNLHRVLLPWRQGKFSRLRASAEDTDIRVRPHRVLPGRGERTTGRTGRLPSSFLASRRAPGEIIREVISLTPRSTWRKRPEVGGRGLSRRTFGFFAGLGSTMMELGVAIDLHRDDPGPPRMVRMREACR